MLFAPALTLSLYNPLPPTTSILKNSTPQKPSHKKKIHSSFTSIVPVGFRIHVLRHTSHLHNNAIPTLVGRLTIEEHHVAVSRSKLR
jgi:hypothetical protein